MAYSRIISPAFSFTYFSAYFISPVYVLVSIFLILSISNHPPFYDFSLCLTVSFTLLLLLILILVLILFYNSAFFSNYLFLSLHSPYFALLSPSPFCFFLLFFATSFRPFFLIIFLLLYVFLIFYLLLYFSLPFVTFLFCYFLFPFLLHPLPSPMPFASVRYLFFLRLPPLISPSISSFSFFTTSPLLTPLLYYLPFYSFTFASSPLPSF